MQALLVPKPARIKSSFAITQKIDWLFAYPGPETNEAGVAVSR
jgi:hypothetical protein